jgi:hypothetical protein
MTWRHCCNEAGAASLPDILFGLHVPDEGHCIRYSYAASNEAISKGTARVADFIQCSAKAEKTARWQGRGRERRSAGIGRVRLLHGGIKSSCELGNFWRNDSAEWLSAWPAGRFMCFYRYTLALLRNTCSARRGQILRPSMSSFLIAGDCKTWPDFQMPLSG